MVAVFIGIGVLGLLLLVVSLIAGEFLHGLLDSFGSDILSGAAVAGFLAAFGFVGALVAQGTDNAAVSSVAGLAAGLLVGWAAGKATTSLMRGGDEATVRTTSLVGVTGTVVDEIPDTGFGKISVVVAGHLTRLHARSLEPIEAGTPVRVTAVLSPTSVQVTRSDDRY